MSKTLSCILTSLCWASSLSPCVLLPTLSSATKSVQRGRQQDNDNFDKTYILGRVSRENKSGLFFFKLGFKKGLLSLWMPLSYSNTLNSFFYSPLVHYFEQKKYKDTRMDWQYKYMYKRQSTVGLNSYQGVGLMSCLVLCCVHYMYNILSAWEGWIQSLINRIQQIN